MFQRGRRLFTGATLLLFLVALAHTGGVLSEPVEAGGVELVESMKALRLDLGLGMSPSVFDVQTSLGLTMTVFLVFLGILNLVVAGRDAQLSGLERPFHGVDPDHEPPIVIRSVRASENVGRRGRGPVSCEDGIREDAPGRR